MNKKLVAYRKMIDITQQEMAIKLGICLTTYNHKETGKKEFSQKEMVSITDIIKEKIPDITMDDIFFNNLVITLKTTS
ncbi:helix-turn-helix transcriptional regulator [Clostridium sp. YIM B02551]|uniref:helix-turn-helix transcriptional regulator n=1 Tax=Clostridium sp. YIM B02551 TaxID=2910679 RepID=UPI001EEC0F75|nr:hypothetical protein [Clostridium sp. YIM B02551]